MSQAPEMGNMDCNLMLSLDQKILHMVKGKGFPLFIDHGNTLRQENAPNNPSLEFICMKTK